MFSFSEFTSFFIFFFLDLNSPPYFNFGFVGWFVFGFVLSESNVVTIDL